MILLVEDSQDDERLAVRAVNRVLPHIRMVVARDGKEALLTIDRLGSGGLPRCVFLDLKLPLVSGFDVLREIRSKDETRYLPVVILSSSAEDNDIVEAYRLGANCYVQKPVEFASFLDTVGATAAFWVSHNRCPASS